MTEPPRGKRFQIHLSTAIVMMFVAGVLIWANMHERTGNNARYFGFPFTMLSSNVIGAIRIPSAHLFIAELVIPFNLVAWFIILYSVWFFCEWLIRCRDARKEG